MKTFAMVCALVVSLFVDVASATQSSNVWEQGMSDVFSALQKFEVSSRNSESVRVHAVAGRLAQATGEKWNVLVYSDVEVPAVSFPGNRIGIQVEFAKQLNDNGLAWVLAHEMSHVLAKHNESNYQLLVEKLGREPRSLDEVIEGKQKMVPHLHANEFEADANGVALASAAGFDAAPAGVAVLGILSAEETESHPSTAARIKAILARQK